MTGRLNRRLHRAVPAGRRRPRPTTPRLASCQCGCPAHPAACPRCPFCATYQPDTTRED